MKRLFTKPSFNNFFARKILGAGISQKVSLGSKFSQRSYATYKRFNNQVTLTSTGLNNPTTRRFLGGFLLLSVGFYVTHLEEAPVSKRLRFIWVGESLEKRIGDYTYNQLLAETKGKLLHPNDPVVVEIRHIFERILKASPNVEKDAHRDWKIHVINDPNAPPNAFVLPNAKVFVYSSILPICANKDGVATVLSHEYAHQLARHTSENLSKTPIYGAISLILYTLTGADLLNSFLVNAVFKMPASREMETEADYIGLMLMSRACFDPHESYKLWERMSKWEQSRKLGVGNGVQFLSTHPASATRITNMQKWLPEALQKRDEGGCDQYRQFSDWNPLSPRSIW